MPGKQAKTLTDAQTARLLRLARCRRYPERDRVILLLSFKAGLRAGEIAGLTWPMVLDARGRIAPVIALRDCVAKRGGGRVIPLHPALRRALIYLRQVTGAEGAVVLSERGGPMRASSLVCWFAALYAEAGFDGCSSHSGRRTFITKAARHVQRAGGSIRDVQALAGHRSIVMTQRYIDADSSIQRRLVGML
jgi:integrase